ncbi:N-acetyltransferase [Phytomonospora endophytica]|nr:N-acetyltransferase [Phytomonospora endophytica]
MRDGRERLTDVLGELLEISDRSLLIRRDDGTELKIDTEAVVAAKPVPPRPVRYSAIARLERVAAAHWPAPDTAELGDWILRAADGWTYRANTALAAGEPGMPLDDAVAEVEDWYRRRGLIPAFSVPLPSGRRFGAELEERGWTGNSPTHVMTRSLTDWTAPDRPDLPPVTIGQAPNMDFLNMVSARRGSLPQIALSVLTGAPRTGFATLRADGELLAIARGAVGDGWLGLSLVEVAEAARRRGLATYVIDALIAWAGVDQAYLQVESFNEGAIALYERLGFTLHHTYVNYVAPSAS